MLSCVSHLPFSNLLISRSVSFSEVLCESLHTLIHTFIDVGLCIGEARCLSCLPPKQTPQVGSGLVASPLIHRVTLGTFLDKHLLPFLNVPHVQQLGGEEEMVISVYLCEWYSQPAINVGTQVTLKLLDYC